MSESAITRVTGRAVVVPGADVDTDRIIPARFLKAITFEGLGARVFEDDRKEASARGESHPLDRPEASGARVMIVGSNFGCGSSREHAPRAMHQWGIRAVVSESFSEIFASNAVAIGLVCVTVPAATVRDLMAAVAEDSGIEVDVDLESMQLTAGGQTVPIAMPHSARHAFTTGAWDATHLLLEHYEDVEAVRARLPYLNFR